MATRFITRIGSSFATRMIGRSGDDPSDPIHATLMTGVTSSRHNSGESRVNHLCPSKGLGGQMTEFAGSGRRKMIRRFGDDPSNPGQSCAMTRRAAGRDPSMVHRGAGKRRGRLMTKLTRARCRKVIRRFRHDPADPGLPGSVAGGTAGCETRMVHRGAGKRRG